MARIVASLLHRPSPDKSKRVTRIPVGGHTEKTLLRGQTQLVTMIDEVAFFPEVAEEPVIIEASTPEDVEFFREHPEVFEEVPETVVPTEEVGPEVIADVAPVIVTPVQVTHEDEFLKLPDPADEAAPEETAPVTSVFEEEVVEKFDYTAFLAQKAAVIKTALATGDHDHHLAALTEFETAGEARKNVLGYIAGRVQA